MQQKYQHHTHAGSLLFVSKRLITENFQCEKAKHKLRFYSIPGALETLSVGSFLQHSEVNATVLIYFSDEKMLTQAEGFNDLQRSCVH